MFNILTVFQLKTPSSVKTAGSGGILNPSEQMSLFSRWEVVTIAFLLCIMAYRPLTSAWSVKVAAFWETKSLSTHIHTFTTQRSGHCPKMSVIR